MEEQGAPAVKWVGNPTWKVSTGGNGSPDVVEHPWVAL